MKLLAKISAALATLLLVGAAFAQVFTVNGAPFLVNGATFSAVASSSAPTGLHVVGSTFENASGTVVQLRGANMSGMENSPIQGGAPWGDDGGTPAWSTYATWGANAVRIPLNAASWLGLTTYNTTGTGSPTGWVQNNLGVGNGTADPDGNYQAAVIAAVVAAQAQGMYVILDLHWSAPQFTIGGVTHYLSPLNQQPSFANADTDITFWTSIANMFGTQATPQTGVNNANVLFELFNEPFLDSFGGTLSAGSYNAAMLSGGTSSQFPNGSQGGTNFTISQTWNIAGYQAMLNAIRATGAHNILIANGGSYAQQLESRAYFPTDSLSPPQLAAGWHPYGSGTYTSGNVYPKVGNDSGGNAATAVEWANAVIASGIPLIATEDGGNGGSNLPADEAIIFTGIPASSSTGGTLTANWPLSTGSYNILFKTGASPLNVLGSFTSGSTAVTWSAPGVTISSASANVWSEPHMAWTQAWANWSGASYIAWQWNGTQSYGATSTQNYLTAFASNGTTILPIQGAGSTTYAWMTGTSPPPQAATPTFSPSAGTYSSTQTVTISDSTASSTIYYTTDGSAPTTGSSVYSTALTVSATTTVKAIATAGGYSQSAVGSAVYTITATQATTPTFSPAAGSYGSTQTVTISDSTTSPTIYYTIDGTTPTTGSTVYSTALTVSATTTVKAIATAAGYSQSSVGSATYTISGGGGPSAPTNVLLTNQGGSANTSGSTQQLAWNSVAGATSYNVYREVGLTGGYALLANVPSGTTYSDTTATNGNGITTVIAATIYGYAVTAVNGSGESVKAYPKAYYYQNGVATQAQTDYSYNLTSLNWQDTTHTQAGSTHDILFTIPTGGGGFQPVSFIPFTPDYELELGAFNYVTADVYLTDTTHTLFLLSLARPGGTSGGDVQPHSMINIVTGGTSPYGTPVLNGWATLKIPLSALYYGITQVMGYISGTTMTVTSITSGPGLEAAGVITGAGVTAGTYISATPGQNGVGTYTLNQSMTVGSSGSPVALTSQRTAMYKLNFGGSGAGSATTVAMDNIGFTTQ